MIDKVFLLKKAKSTKKLHFLRKSKTKSVLQLKPSPEIDSVQLRCVKESTCWKRKIILSIFRNEFWSTRKNIRFEKADSVTEKFASFIL